MTRRTARVVSLAIGVLLFAAGAAVLWLLHTDSGARWLFARVETALGDRLSAASVQGTLGGGLTIDELRYRDDAGNVAIERVTLAIDPDLIPTRLVIESLIVESVTWHPSGEARATDDAGPPLDELLPRLAMPLPLVIRDVAVTEVAIVRPDGNRDVLLSSLSVAGRYFESIEVADLEVETPAARLTGEGGLGLARPFAIAPGTRLSFATAGREQPLRASVELGGSLSEAEITVNGASPEATISGTLALLADEPRFSLVANTPRVTWPLGGADPLLALEHLTLEAEGRLSDYVVELSGDFLSRASGRLQVAARGAGNLGELEVGQLVLHSSEVDASVRGALQWSESFTVAADVDIERLDPARFVPEWPRETHVSGRIAGSYSALRLELSRLALAHSAGPASVRGNAVLDFDQGVVDGDLDWSELQWPLSPGVPNVESASGRVQVRGEPADWAVSGDVVLGAPGLADGRFRIAGRGDRGHVEVEIADSEVLGGRITGDLSYNWAGTGAWSTTLSASSIRLQPLLPDWPGELSTELTASGQLQPFEMHVDVGSLNGRLRDRAIGAAGRVTVAGGDIRADGFTITSGDSRVTLDGDYRSEGGMSFEMSLASLGDLVPAGAGRVQAAGRLAAGGSLPLLELDLTATGLHWQEHSIEKLSIANRPSPDTPFALAIDAEDVVVAANALDIVTMSLAGSAAEHRFASRMALGESSVGIVLAGGVDQVRSLPEMRWNGRLLEADVRSGETLSMSLREPRAVSLAARSMTLQRICLDAGGNASVCASGSLSASGAYAAVVELSAMPLDLVRLLADTDLAFSQTLTGTLQVSKPPHGRVSAGGRIDISAGHILNPLDERLTLNTRPGFARFALNEGSLLAGEVSLPFSELAEIGAQFRVVDVGRGAESPVEGRITANVSDIGVGASVVPAIDEAAGRLTADIRIDGKLAEPQFRGSASLHDGLLAYDPLGVRVEDIQLDSEIRAGNRIEVRSTFRAGDGRGEITTSADYLQGRQAGLELAFAGSDLTLIDVPDLRVKADADLRVGLQNDDITINGRVVLPEARLSSVNVARTTVSESPDVEFVGAGAPPEENEQQTASPLEFGGSVELELGEEVVIDVDVAEARLQGASTFTWNGPAMPRASGQYEVSGKFEAYGQLLEITEGSIRYPNVPANRPELRIRAEREIFGNSQVRRAGVLVTGTALRPTLEVYTTPATNEDRALTLLATGSDFDYEQGVGAVDVGTYIAPRLYASYGIGLFDKENVISVRYDLASGFGIKATSGKRAAGVDISYTIEH